MDGKDDTLEASVAPPPVSRRMLAPGDVVGGRFAIDRVAGAGGMGAVYRAVDRTTGATVAVKVLRAGDAHAVRFARETKLLATLEHDAVVRYVSHGIGTSGEPYLAMEWLEGEDLMARLGRGPLTLDDSIAVVRRVAEALAFTHARGIVHRDLKPSNIYLPNRDPAQCKVIDFGVARHADSSIATQFGTIIGTPAYMSPEQARGQANVDARTDVFALGAVLFECVVGHRAFRGDTTTAILTKLIFEPPPRLSDHAPDAPMWLALLVDRMLQRDPAMRPADGAEMVEVMISRSVSSSPRTWLSGRALSRMFVVMARIDKVDASASRPVAIADTVNEGDADVVVLVNGTHVHVVTGEGEASDLALQAVRRALRMRRDLRCRQIVVATGVGTTESGAPAGDAIDRASRLLANAGGRDGDPALVVDATTAELLRNRFVFCEGGGGHELVDELGVTARPRLLLGQRAPCVGRDRELALLAAAFSECVDESAAAGVLVTAPAGTGKSRLCDEFVAGVLLRHPDVRLIAASADPMSAGAPLEIVRVLVRAGLGVVGDDPSEALGRLAERIGGALSPDEARRTVSFLGELLGAPGTAPDLEVAAARLDQQLLRDQMLRAFELWLRVETDGAPVLVVIDDLHWADLASARYLQWALERHARRRLFVAMFARPEARELFPELARARGVQELSVRPLSRNACERLVRHVLANDITEETLERIYSISGGNAFYTEELIRVVAKGTRELPESLIASLQVRLARLAPAEQQLMRAASVFGDVFWVDGVERILSIEGGSRPILDRLVAFELVERRAESRFVGRDEYRFRHDLLREASYALLRDDDEVKAHLVAAEWLLDAGERHALAIATHFDRGRDAARAASHYVSAAEQDLRAGNLEAALARTGRARELGLSGDELDRVLGVELEVFKWLARGPEVVATAREILRRSPERSELRFRAMPELALFSMDQAGAEAEQRTLVAELEAAEPGSAAHAWLLAALRLAQFAVLAGRADAVTNLLARAERVMDDQPDLRPLVEGWLWDLRGQREGISRPSYYLDASRQARVCFERIADHRNVCYQLFAESIALFSMGDLDETERVAGALLVRLDELGITRLRDKLELCIALTRAWRGNTDERARITLAIEGLAQPLRDYYTMVGETVLAELELDVGRLEAAETIARRAWERGKASRIADGAGILALVRTSRGFASEALELLLAPAPQSAVWYHHVVRLRARARAHARLGRMDKARDATLEAIEFVERIAATLPDDAAREKFWRGYGECIRVCALATELGVELPGVANRVIA